MQSNHKRVQIKHNHTAAREGVFSIGPVVQSEKLIVIWDARRNRRALGVGYPVCLVLDEIWVFGFLLSHRRSGTKYRSNCRRRVDFHFPLGLNIPVKRLFSFFITYYFFFLTAFKEKGDQLLRLDSAGIIFLLFNIGRSETTRVGQFPAVNVSLSLSRANYWNKHLSVSALIRFLLMNELWATVIGVSSVIRLDLKAPLSKMRSNYYRRANFI